MIFQKFYCRERYIIVVSYDAKVVTLMAFMYKHLT